MERIIITLQSDPQYFAGGIMYCSMRKVLTIAATMKDGDTLEGELVVTDDLGRTEWFSGPHRCKKAGNWNGRCGHSTRDRSRQRIAVSIYAEPVGVTFLRASLRYVVLVG